MNRHVARLSRVIARLALVLAATGLSGVAMAAPVADPGRLFYTPQQRAQLEAARAGKTTRPTPTAQEVETAAPPLRFDGVVVRSDGSRTSWVNGRPQVGTAGVTGLKPGQIRADGKVYEPYQVLRPVEANRVSEEAKP